MTEQEAIETYRKTGRHLGIFKDPATATSYAKTLHNEQAREYGGGFVPPRRLPHGFMTSGRRTVEGNRIVGGVPDSGHLRGTDADFDGPDLNAVLGDVRGLPGFEKAFIHKGHVHARGKWNVPYFGKHGTKGLKR